MGLLRDPVDLSSLPDGDGGPDWPKLEQRRARPLEVLEPREIEVLLKACGRSATGLRNRALISLMWRAGLRVSEALAVESRDVDLGAGTVRVRRGKGGRARVVGLDNRLELELGRWIRARPAGAGPIICTLQGGPVSPDYVRQMLRRVARRAEVDRRVHPHGLRHAFAREFARQPDVGLLDVRDALGHARASTTEVYLRDVGSGSAARLMRARR
jgi:site-specific recombinase XerD